MRRTPLARPIRRTLLAALATALAGTGAGLLPPGPSAGAAGAATAGAPSLELALGAAPGAAGEARVRSRCLESVPEPGSKAPVQICYTVFRPAGATRRHRVPVLLHSHGWGGKRATAPDEVATYLEAGYAVVSYDQRGFGQSGGKARVGNPAYEGRDVRRLVAAVSRLPWIAKDGPRDPRMGAVGGSYGGGYQFLAAFELLRTRGTPVLDAIAPEITWHDLNTSLAPEGVVRTEWALALSAASLPSNALPPMIYKALVEGTLLGTWPDGSVPGIEDLVPFFERNGPSWHVAQGRRLDIPVLLGQGMTDTLFNIDEGLDNWQRALTPRARRRSIFVGYNGGHVLPGLLPQTVAVTSDPCSAQLAGGDFADLSVRFFDHVLRGRRTGLTGWGRYHLATSGSTCTVVDSVAPADRLPAGEVTTPSALGVPLAFPVAEGPVRVAGRVALSGRLTTLTPGSRAFYGLAIGRTALDAKLVQGNVLPLDEPEVVSGERRRIQLPAVAVDVPAGQRLFVVATAISDMFLLMGSRTPGAVVLEDATVHLNLVD